VGSGACTKYVRIKGEGVSNLLQTLVICTVLRYEEGRGRGQKSRKIAYVFCERSLGTLLQNI
jgi:hypothetical protein